MFIIFFLFLVSTFYFYYFYFWRPDNLSPAARHPLPVTRYSPPTTRHPSPVTRGKVLPVNNSAIVSTLLLSSTALSLFRVSVFRSCFPFKPERKLSNYGERSEQASFDSSLTLSLQANCRFATSLACEQALLFGRAKQVSRERASEGPLARAFSRGSLK